MDNIFTRLKRTDAVLQLIQNNIHVKDADKAKLQKLFSEVVTREDQQEQLAKLKSELEQKSNILHQQTINELSTKL